MASRALVGTVYNADFEYHIKFKDSSLSDADIKPVGNRASSPIVSTFAKVADFPFIESPGGKPGERWSRPSYFGIGDFKVLTNEYEAWKVLDGDLEPLQENADPMVKLLSRKIGGAKILRFLDDCLPQSKPSAAEAARSP
eukprot:UN4455